jgi:hypothetical protein
MRQHRGTCTSAWRRRGPHVQRRGEVIADFRTVLLLRRVRSRGRRQEHAQGVRAFLHLRATKAKSRPVGGKHSDTASASAQALLSLTVGHRHGQDGSICVLELGSSSRQMAEDTLWPVLAFAPPATLVVDHAALPAL